MAKWALYHDFDPFKCEVVREAIKAGAVADGEVICGDIKELAAGDVRRFRQFHAFCGGAFWSLALRQAGWPDSRPVWTGSCPCPSFSAAGKGEGFADARHLWPEWYRLIRECRPSVVFGEQVAAAIGHGWLDLVCGNLEAEGYAVAAAVLGAHSAGAPHIRQRLCFCADAAHSDRRSGKRGEETGIGADGIGRRGFAGGCATISGAESMHAQRRPVDEPGPDGCDGQDSGRTEAHGITGTCGEVLGSIDTEKRGLAVRGSTSGNGRHAAQPGEPERSAEAAEVRRQPEPPISGLDGAGAGAGRAQSEPGGGCDVDGPDHALGAGLEGHFGDVREWRGPGWLDPLTARSVAEAGATRGYWADCDWWYGRDEKYRPIGAGISPLVSGTVKRRVFEMAARDSDFLGLLRSQGKNILKEIETGEERVGRLRIYGDAICVPLAVQFIKAYMEVCRA